MILAWAFPFKKTKMFAHPLVKLSRPIVGCPRDREVAFFEFRILRLKGSVI